VFDILPSELMSQTSASRVVVTDSFDWSNTGRGKHVEFGKHEQLPLEIGRQLGRGSTSDVHETKCRGLAIAVKRRYLARIILDSAPFKKEMSNLERVSGHDHIVQIIGSFVHNRVIGILLWPVAICDLGTFLDDWNELVGIEMYGPVSTSNMIVQKIGQDGFARLKALNAINARPTVMEIRHFYELKLGYRRIYEAFGCISAALAYIHGQKVKHKDLKPSNILLTRDNIYITDFGTSTDFAANLASETETGIRGTPQYFAPEVAEYLPSGRSADVFSLGCIFIEMLCVASYIPLREPQDLRPNRDHSYHANLQQTLLWVDSRLGRSPIALAIIEMLHADPKLRPSALDVFKGIRGVEHESFGSTWVMCGKCCEDLVILA
jgi:serine/threonine protein kinase